MRSAWQQTRERKRAELETGILALEEAWDENWKDTAWEEEIQWEIRLATVTRIGDTMSYLLYMINAALN